MKKVDAERIVALYAEGLSGAEIARRTGYSESTVRNYRRAKRCECGALVSTSDGVRHEQCADCDAAAKRAAKYWTRLRVIDALQRWAKEHGRTPTPDDWLFANRLGQYPSRSSVYRTSTNPTSPFATWLDAIDAAGLPRVKRGCPVYWTRDRIKDALNDWLFAHGEWPRSTDLQYASPEYPSYWTVRAMFGNWEAALAAAGKPRERAAA